MRIIDGHLDLAYNAVTLGRDLTQPLAVIREREGTPPPHHEGTATLSLPEIRHAGVRIILATIFTYPESGMEHPVKPGYRTPDEAFLHAREQVAYYHHLQAEGEVTIIHDQDSLNAVLDGHAPAPGLCLLMEGADPIRALPDLAYFYDRGVRVIGLAWKGTRYAAGANAPGPLTDAGRDLLREMDRLGIALDAGHLAEEAFWQALDIFHGRVIASHANCRVLVPGERQLCDEMIRAIAERDGVIGLILYNRFIRPEWQAADGKDAVSISDLLPHLDHLRSLVGTRHIALGSDLDGGIGREVVPREIDSIADLPRVANLLASSGYDSEEVTDIMGGNWLRVLRALFR